MRQNRVRCVQWQPRYFQCELTSPFSSLRTESRMYSTVECPRFRYLGRPSQRQPIFHQERWQGSTQNLVCKEVSCKRACRTDKPRVQRTVALPESVLPPKPAFRNPTSQYFKVISQPPLINPFSVRYKRNIVHQIHVCPHPPKQPAQMDVPYPHLPS
jgi:hypothetical protein